MRDDGQVIRGQRDRLLLGEWACLGIVYPAPTHGFAVAARLKPAADVGRVWSLSRPLTYRSLDQLIERDFVEPVGEEPGIAGGNRTILAATRAGRAAFRTWARTPVQHVRDLRSELLLKLILADVCAIDVGPMLAEQRAQVNDLRAHFDGAVGAHDDFDLVASWRAHATDAALRFLDDVIAVRGERPD